MARLFQLFLLALVACPVEAGEIASDRSSENEIYTLRQGHTEVKFAPFAGANAFSIRFRGIEALRQPKTREQLPGVAFGNPILYPTPNRIRNARFAFAGKTVQFPANAGKNHIHGLVNRHRWQVVDTATDGNSASIRCLADFRVGTDLYRQFPFAHRLWLTLRVGDASVRWTYEVDNSDGEDRIPFGFALHPYFVYQGRRESTHLTIPATHWMESVDKLPTGQLVSAGALDFPLRRPLCLKNTSFDDVFWGMQPERPTLIDFRDRQRQITIRASQDFTHLVVWTPDRPYFGVESQTCSTDAHNLSTTHAKSAHLQVCEPGQKMSGWVEYQFGEHP